MIAFALRDWLPLVIQACKGQTYMSDRDNEAGILWGETLSLELEASNFGIVCLTPENLQAPWILFEAGALSKAVGKARVVPLLYKLHPADVGLPLSRFQMKRLDEQGIFDLIKSMNSVVEEQHKLDDGDLMILFHGMFRELQARLSELPSGDSPPHRTERQLLEEILELTRRTANSTVLSSESASVATPTLDSIPDSYLPLVARIEELTRASRPAIVTSRGEVIVRAGIIEKDIGHAQTDEISMAKRILATKGLKIIIEWPVL
jgi:hypothetical protein